MVSAKGVFTGGLLLIMATGALGCDLNLGLADPLDVNYTRTAYDLIILRPFQGKQTLLGRGNKVVLDARFGFASLGEPCQLQMLLVGIHNGNPIVNQDVSADFDSGKCVGCPITEYNPVVDFWLIEFHNNNSFPCAGAFFPAVKQKYQTSIRVPDEGVSKLRPFEGAPMTWNGDVLNAIANCDGSLTNLGTMLMMAPPPSKQPTLQCDGQGRILTLHAIREEFAPYYSDPHVSYNITNQYGFNRDITSNIVFGNCTGCPLRYYGTESDTVWTITMSYTGNDPNWFMAGGVAADCSAGDN